jgi:heptosyltransferase III
MTITARIDLPPQPRILVVALRRLGDVLLTTPLLRSLRHAWPDATIDALVFADTAGILAGNPDSIGIVTMPARPTAVQSLALAARLWRKYDLAVSTQSGDRPTFFTYIAGRHRAGQVLAGGGFRRALLDRAVPRVEKVHRVEEVLRLADALGIPRVPEVVGPSHHAATEVPGGAYAVIHAAPFYRYKQWTKDGWRNLASWLGSRGFGVVSTGGPDEGERRYLDWIWSGMDAVRRVDGRLDWSPLMGVLAGARVFIGPDTSVTHLAAASGCPTVAIYGPTDPRLWGPWPQGGLQPGWDAGGTIQNRGNVWLVQNPLPCMPCQLEGCERGTDSYSQCLEELPVEHVMTAVKQALG